MERAERMRRKWPKLPQFNPLQKGLAKMAIGAILTTVGEGLIEQTFPFRETIHAFYHNFFSHSLSDNYAIALTDFAKAVHASPFGASLVVSGATVLLWGTGQAAWDIWKNQRHDIL